MKHKTLILLFLVATLAIVWCGVAAMTLTWIDTKAAGLTDPLATSMACFAQCRTSDAAQACFEQRCSK